MRIATTAAFDWMIRLLQRLQPEEVIAPGPELAGALAMAELPVRELGGFANLSDFLEAGRYVQETLAKLEPCEATWILAHHLGHMATRAAALDRARPDLILVHNDVEPVPRLLCLWARARGVPAVHVPHAVYLDETFRGGMGEDVHDLVAATHLAAACPYQARWYQARGDAEIRITGAPRWDDLPTWRSWPREASRRLLGIRPEEIAVVYATSWAQHTSAKGSRIDPFAYFQRFLESARSWPSRVVLLVKLHPSQADGQAYLKALEESGRKGIVTQAHLPHVLKAADRVIAFTASNVLLEAAYLGVPILVHGTQPPWKGAYALDEIPWRTVEEATVPELSDFLEPIGGSLERVAQWIEEIYHGDHFGDLPSREHRRLAELSH